MKIALGGDHIGFLLKGTIKEAMESMGNEVKDFGCFSEETVDFPECGTCM